MKVYVVTKGQNLESEDVVSVHKTLEGAITAAKQIKTPFNGEWRPSTDEDSPVRTHWCDYVSVQEVEVQK